MKVVIAATGTGGHVNPGIAIANKIKQEEPDSQILFIGTGRGLEKDLVPRANYPLKTIDAYGLQRKISIDNLRKLYKTMRSVKQAKAILQEFQPDIVIGTGGYICLPVEKAARKQKIPMILHESNAFPGMATKLLTPKVQAVLLGFAEARERLPKPEKAVVTGTPTKVRHLHLSPEQKQAMKQALGCAETLPIVVVFGGSQGAQSINTALQTILENHWNENYHIVWALGQEQYDEWKQNLAVEGKDMTSWKNATIVPYIYNMEEMLNGADLVVCRSGAMTVTEVARVGKPAIFIPFPYATENHQEYNAKVLEKQRAARIILDKDLNASLLQKTICSMIEDTEELQHMGERAQQHAIGNVESLIYREIKKILSQRCRVMSKFVE